MTEQEQLKPIVVGSINVKRVVEESKRARTRPNMQEPYEIGSFAIQGREQHHGGKLLLKRFRLPQLPLDLSRGKEKFVCKDEELDGKIDPILSELQHRAIDLGGIDFVSFRNNFNKILLTPYQRNEYEIRAIKLAGTIYLDIVKLNNSNQSPEEASKFTFWGYKFEDYCTRESDEQPAEEPVIDNNDQFCGLFKTKLNNFRIILSAEIDCLEVETRSDSRYDSSAPKRAQKELYVELKTTKQVLSDKDDYNFRRYKLLNFWVQSYLAGIPRIYVGFRDEEGFVTKISKFNTLDLPSIAGSVWDPWVCLNFASEVLALLKAKVTTQKNVYTVQFKYPFDEVIVLDTGKQATIFSEDFLRHISSKQSAADNVPKPEN